VLVTANVAIDNASGSLEEERYYLDAFPKRARAKGMITAWDNISQLLAGTPLSRVRFTTGGGGSKVGLPVARERD